MFELAGFKITDENTQLLHKAATRNSLVLLILDKTLKKVLVPYNQTTEQQLPSG